jgi:hypothetical protein
MFKLVALIGVGAAIGFMPGAVLAEQGTSSSWGTVGWGPVIPTISLTNRDRAWNQAHQSRYQAEDTAEWVRLHGGGGPVPQPR